MYLISAERYKNASAHFLRVRKTGKIWTSMKNMQDSLAVKNVSDLNIQRLWNKKLYEKAN